MKKSLNKQEGREATFTSATIKPSYVQGMQGAVAHLFIIEGQCLFPKTPPISPVQETIPSSI